MSYKHNEKPKSVLDDLALLRRLQSSSVEYETGAPGGRGANDDIALTYNGPGTNRGDRMVNISINAMTGHESSQQKTFQKQLQTKFLPSSLVLSQLKQEQQQILKLQQQKLLLLRQKQRTPSQIAAKVSSSSGVDVDDGNFNFNAASAGIRTARKTAAAVAAVAAASMHPCNAQQSSLLAWNAVEAKEAERKKMLEEDEVHKKRLELQMKPILSEDNPPAFPPSSPTILPGAYIVDEPTKYDILAGRGNRVNNHIGNKRFRELVKPFKVQYLQKTTKKVVKAHMCAVLVDYMRNEFVPRAFAGQGGRFLEKDKTTGKWIDIGDEKARKKAGQALREDATSIRAELGMEKPGSGKASPPPVATSVATSSKDTATPISTVEQKHNTASPKTEASTLNEEQSYQGDAILEEASVTFPGTTKPAFTLSSQFTEEGADAAKEKPINDRARLMGLFRQRSSSSRRVIRSSSGTSTATERTGSASSIATHLMGNLTTRRSSASQRNLMVLEDARKVAADDDFKLTGGELALRQETQKQDQERGNMKRQHMMMSRKVQSQRRLAVAAPPVLEESFNFKDDSFLFGSRLGHFDSSSLVSSTVSGAAARGVTGATGSSRRGSNSSDSSYDLQPIISSPQKSDTKGSESISMNLKNVDQGSASENESDNEGLRGGDVIAAGPGGLKSLLKQSRRSAGSRQRASRAAFYQKRHNQDSSLDFNDDSMPRLHVSSRTIHSLNLSHSINQMADAEKKKNAQYHNESEQTGVKCNLKESSLNEGEEEEDEGTPSKKSLSDEEEYVSRLYSKAPNEQTYIVKERRDKSESGAQAIAIQAVPHPSAADHPLMQSCNSSSSGNSTITGPPRKFTRRRTSCSSRRSSLLSRAAKQQQQHLSSGSSAGLAKGAAASGKEEQLGATTGIPGGGAPYCPSGTRRSSMRSSISGSRARRKSSICVNDLILSIEDASKQHESGAKSMFDSSMTMSTNFGNSARSMADFSFMSQLMNELHDLDDDDEEEPEGDQKFTNQAQQQGVAPLHRSVVFEEDPGAGDGTTMNIAYTAAARHRMRSPGINPTASSSTEAGVHSSPSVSGAEGVSSAQTSANKNPTLSTTSASQQESGGSGTSVTSHSVHSHISMMSCSSMVLSGNTRLAANDEATHYSSGSHDHTHKSSSCSSAATSCNLSIISQGHMRLLEDPF